MIVVIILYLKLTVLLWEIQSKNIIMIDCLSRHFDFRINVKASLLSYYFFLMYNTKEASRFWRKWLDYQPRYVIFHVQSSFKFVYKIVIRFIPHLNDFSLLIAFSYMLNNLFDVLRHYRGHISKANNRLLHCSESSTRENIIELWFCFC
jgi:hypothetical protein